MRKVSMNSKAEIVRMELVNTKFITQKGKAISTHLKPETINKKLFVELFCDVDVQELFSQKIFSRN